MKAIRSGKWLTGDESTRLAIINSVDRQTLIEHLAAELRERARAEEARMRNSLNPRVRGVR